MEKQGFYMGHYSVHVHTGFYLLCRYRLSSGRSDASTESHADATHFPEHNFDTGDSTVLLQSPAEYRKVQDTTQGYTLYSQQCLQGSLES